MKRVVKRIAIVLVAVTLLAVSMIPMVAFEVKRYYGDIDNDGRVTVTDARNILLEAIELYEGTLDEHDIAAIDIKEATSLLGDITGKDASSDVVNKIFEKFCLGK